MRWVSSNYALARIVNFGLARFSFTQNISRVVVIKFASADGGHTDPRSEINTRDTFNSNSFIYSEKSYAIDKVKENFIIVPSYPNHLFIK